MQKTLIHSLIWILLCVPAYGALVERYVNTGADAAGDGTTSALSSGDNSHAYQGAEAWQAAEVTDLQVAGDSHTVYFAATGGAADDFGAPGLIISTTWNSGAANRLTMQQTDRSADGVWSDSVYRMTASNNQTVINVRGNYNTLRNVQVLSPVTAGNTATAIQVNNVAGGGSDNVFDGCLLKGSGEGASHSGFLMQDGDNTATIFNCTVDSFHRSLNQNGATVNLYNTVLYNAYGDGIRCVGATLNLSNSVNHVTPGSNAYSTSVATFNFDSILSTEPFGDNALNAVDLDWDNEFVDANNANADFHPVSGGNILVAGVNDPSSGEYSNDIAGEAYVTDSWARGVYAGEAGGSGQFISIISKEFWTNFLQDLIDGTRSLQFGKAA